MSKQKFLELYNKGLQAFKDSNLNEAILKWEKATNIDPNVSEIHSILGNAYKLLNDFDKSSAALKKAVKLDPTNFKYLYNYGIILFDKGDYEHSAEVMKKALELDPQNVELINDLGVIEYRLGNYQRAKEYLLDAHEKDKKNKETLLNLFYLFLELEDFLKAKDTLDDLKRLDFNEDKLEKLTEYLDSFEKAPKQHHDFLLEVSGKSFSISPIEMLENQIDEISHRKIDLSIVIPLMNEVKNVPILYKQLKDVLKTLKQDYEIIWIDDGSYDGTLEVLQDIAQKDSCVKVIQFRRNYGQTAALSAGFKYAVGEVIITMDGDLQNDPTDIPRLLEKMSEGYDLVSGWRRDRKDKNLTRKVPSKIANRIINKLIEGTHIQLHDFGCTLKAYKKGIVKNIHLYGEMHRFIPVFAAWIGVKVTEIPVKHHARIHGSAKYNLSRVSRVIFDLIVVRFFADYMTRPIQFFGKIAKKLFGFGTLALALLTILKIFFSGFFVSLNTLLILFGLLTVSSGQIILMGLLGEIVMRIYFEGQKKDAFIIEKIIKK